MDRGVELGPVHRLLQQGAQELREVLETLLEGLVAGHGRDSGAPALVDELSSLKLQVLVLVVVSQQGDELVPVLPGEGEARVQRPFH